jgi:2-oxoacid:acceptor oxidoreductase delta subunit (pyruvate/2-ketoisovalerate family)
VAITTKYEVPWEDRSAIPIFMPKTGDWRYERPVTNEDRCNQCGLCYFFCPTGCIVVKVSYFVADLDYCKGCGICADECPTQAISMVREEGK